MNGDWYEGTFVDGKRNGQGVYYHASGDRYEETYVDDKMNGHGVCPNHFFSIHHGNCVSFVCSNLCNLLYISSMDTRLLDQLIPLARD